MQVREATITLIDFEGTGKIRAYADEPWQVGLVLLRRGEIVRESMTSQFLYVSDRPFNPHAPGRHAECREALAAAPNLPDLWPTLRHWFESDAIVAHNIATEKRYLRTAFPMVRMPPWIDTLFLSRAAYPGLKSYALENLVVSLKLSTALDELVPNRGPHDALYDAVASALLFQKLIASDNWRDLSLEALRTVRP
ncbi:MAG: 3'-5' exonuclease [Verrucomicrobia bacterium]|nr:3'-5' exonuclease [Verrucomicrobiota bacterium]